MERLTKSKDQGNGFCRMTGLLVVPAAAGVGVIVLFAGAVVPAAALVDERAFVVVLVVATATLVDGGVVVVVLVVARAAPGDGGAGNVSGGVGNGHCVLWDVVWFF